MPNKPKLLSINNYHYRRGGSDAVYLDHAELFKSEGWSTADFAMQHPNNLPSPWSEYFIQELEFGHKYGLAHKLAMAGKVIYSFEAREKMSRLLKRFTPDVAHAHCIYHHISPSVLSLLHERGIPTVMTAHDLKLACPAYKMLNKHGICEKCKHGNLAHLIKNRCIHDSLTISTLIAVESGLHKIFGLYKNNLNSIVVPSQFFRNKLMEWGWPGEKLVYIPNFIDCSKYIPKYEPGKYFLYFGRLAPEKGVDTLIRAAIQANVELRIAGTGPYENELKTLIPEANAKIQFLGFCSGNKLTDLIRDSRAVVLPSQWYENAPISILEAYASGKPVIGADIGGIPEMLLSEQTGYLFDSGNTNELADKLNTVSKLANSSIVSMGRMAQHYVNTTYTVQRYFDEMLNLYKSLGVVIDRQSNASLQ